MLNIEKLNIGIVGVGGRLAAFLSAIQDSRKSRLTAVCDLNTESMDKAIEGIEGVKKFTDYSEMLQKGDHGTHSLGSVLSWFEGDRVEKVSCIGSGFNFSDKFGKPYMQENT